jgi:hypothetical protein
MKKHRDLRAAMNKGDLVDFVDVMKAQTVGLHGASCDYQGHFASQRCFY